MLSRKNYLSSNKRIILVRASFECKFMCQKKLEVIFVAHWKKAFYCGVNMKKIYFSTVLKLITEWD